MEYVCFDKDTKKILCNDTDLIYVKSIPPITTTTTTTVKPTTTTTTTMSIVEIYYGISSKTRVNESDILSSFSVANGNVGSLEGRLYNFSSGYSYKYWCIPWDYNNPEQVINEIRTDSKVSVLAYDSYYNYYQVNPTPNQSITYGKIEINNISYRIYRLITKNSKNEYYVYSF